MIAIEGGSKFKSSWRDLLFFFHSLGWLAIPHRMVRGMRVQRMPIKGILLEGQVIISSGGWAQESAHNVGG